MSRGEDVDEVRETTGTTGRRRDLAATRTALVSAAAEVFAERGMDGASLAEIAARAGYTRGAIYHQFASKDELFIEVMRHHDERLLDGYRTALREGERPDLDEAIRRWRQLHPDDDVTVALRLELRSHALRDPTLRDQLVETDHAAVSATAEHLEKFDIPMPADVPVHDVAELLHIVSQAAQERGVLSGDDKAHLMASMLEILWRPRD